MCVRVCVCACVQETAKNTIIKIGLALPSAGTPLSRDWGLIVRGSVWRVSKVLHRSRWHFLLRVRGIVGSSEWNREKATCRDL